jgi:pyruvate dehydrogenase E1 component
MDHLHLRHTASTGSAAQACLAHIARHPLDGTRASPLFTVTETVRRLQQAAATGDRLWVINDRMDETAGTGPVSAWPLWFSEQSRNDERPLFYLTQSPTSAHLSMLTAQTAERGIILNDIESAPSRWAKGAHPWLPLWLATNRQCTPFDPACGEEASAILAGALQDLYVDGQPGFYYLTLHDEPGDKLPCDRSQASLGMYRLDAGPQDAQAPRVRLLGAGLMLREVRAAAALLQERWGVCAEVWSCPSYTRLARDAERHARRNRFGRGNVTASCHLHVCLAGATSPVVAVTGYAEFVAAQLAAYVTAPFTALGSDSLEPGQRLDRHWIVAAALRGLAGQGVISEQRVAEALEVYRLG